MADPQALFNPVSGNTVVTLQNVEYRNTPEYYGQPYGEYGPEGKIVGVTDSGEYVVQVTKSTNAPGAPRVGEQVTVSPSQVQGGTLEEAKLKDISYRERTEGYGKPLQPGEIINIDQPGAKGQYQVQKVESGTAYLRSTAQPMHVQESVALKGGQSAKVRADPVPAKQILESPSQVMDTPTMLPYIATGTMSQTQEDIERALPRRNYPGAKTKEEMGLGFTGEIGPSMPVGFSLESEAELRTTQIQKYKSMRRPLTASEELEYTKLKIEQTTALLAIGAISSITSIPEIIQHPELLVTPPTEEELQLSRARYGSAGAGIQGLGALGAGLLLGKAGGKVTSYIYEKPAASITVKAKLPSVSEPTVAGAKGKATLTVLAETPESTTYNPVQGTYEVVVKQPPSRAGRLMKDPVAETRADVYIQEGIGKASESQGALDAQVKTVLQGEISPKARTSSIFRPTKVEDISGISSEASSIAEGTSSTATSISGTSAGDLAARKTSVRMLSEESVPGYVEKTYGVISEEKIVNALQKKTAPIDLKIAQTVRIRTPADDVAAGVVEGTPDKPIARKPPGSTLAEPPASEIVMLEKKPPVIIEPLTEVVRKAAVDVVKTASPESLAQRTMYDTIYTTEGAPAPIGESATMIISGTSLKPFEPSPIALLPFISPPTLAPQINEIQSAGMVPPRSVRMFDIVKYEMLTQPPIESQVPQTATDIIPIETTIVTPDTTTTLDTTLLAPTQTSSIPSALQPPSLLDVISPPASFSVPLIPPFIVPGITPRRKIENPAAAALRIKQMTVKLGGVYSRKEFKVIADPLAEGITFFNTGKFGKTPRQTKSLIEKSGIGVPTTFLKGKSYFYGKSLIK